METKAQNDVTGGVFLLSKTNPAQVFTPEDFNEEQQLMKASVIEFIDREVWPYKERFEKKDYAFTEALMKKAGELGFLSIPVPENYGGMGMGIYKQECKRGYPGLSYEARLRPGEAAKAQNGRNSLNIEVREVVNGSKES